MKLYCGRRLPTGDVDVQVLDEDRGVSYPLPHHVRHSPTGYEWGYNGSGPAELARCILLDHYGVPGDDGSQYESELPVSYQQFKFDHVGRLPRELPWTLTSEAIEQWAERNPRRVTR